MVRIHDVGLQETGLLRVVQCLLGEQFERGAHLAEQLDTHRAIATAPTGPGVAGAGCIAMSHSALNNK